MNRSCPKTGHSKNFNEAIIALMGDSADIRGMKNFYLRLLFVETLRFDHQLNTVAPYIASSLVFQKCIL